MVNWQELEYLESTGTQYIDTGLIADSDTDLYVDYFDFGIANTVLLGARGSGWSDRSYVIMAQVSMYLDYGSIRTILSGNNRPTTNQRHIIEFISGKLYVDGALKASPGGTFVTPYSQILFGLQGNSGPAVSMKTRIYRVIYKKNGSVLRYYIAAKDGNGVVCMYEAVSGTFYYNAGTGVFTGGPKLADHSASSGIDQCTFLKGVAVGRQLKGWATAGAGRDINRDLLSMRVYNAYSDGRWAGPFPAGNSSYAIPYREGSAFLPDWTRPFHIHTKVKFDAIPSGNDRSFIYGTAVSNEYFRNPSIEIRNNYHFFFGFSTTGTGWPVQLDIGGTQNPDDNLPIVANRAYELDLAWDGAVVTASVFDGTARVTKTAANSTPHYRSASYPFCWGNNALTTDDSDNHTIIDLDHTWIKVDGAVVWGAR